MRFTPTKRARSPATRAKGGTSCETIASPAVKPDSPMRTNWCTAVMPPSTA